MSFARGLLRLAESYLWAPREGHRVLKLAVRKSDSSEIPAANLGRSFLLGQVKEALRFSRRGRRAGAAALHYKLGLIYANLSDYASQGPVCQVVEPTGPAGWAAKR
jgi:hypothetical protein